VEFLKLKPFGKVHSECTLELGLTLANCHLST